MTDDFEAALRAAGLGISRDGIVMPAEDASIPCPWHRERQTLLEREARAIYEAGREQGRREATPPPPADDRPPPA